MAAPPHSQRANAEWSMALLPTKLQFCGNPSAENGIRDIFKGVIGYFTTKQCLK